MVWVIGAICMIFFGAALVAIGWSMATLGYAIVGGIRPGRYSSPGVHSAIPRKHAASPLGWVFCKRDNRPADRSEPFSPFFPRCRLLADAVEKVSFSIWTGAWSDVIECDLRYALLLPYQLDTSLTQPTRTMAGSEA